VTGGAGTVNCGAGNFASCGVLTNASGVATLTAWTLGAASGTSNNTLNAANATVSVNFTASANPGAGPPVTLFTRNDQTARINTTVATDPSVRVRDTFGNDVCGATVTFTVQTGGGSVTGGSPVASCGIFGAIATVTSWTISNGSVVSGGAYSNTLRAASG